MEIIFVFIGVFVFTIAFIVSLVFIVKRFNKKPGGYVKPKQEIPIKESTGDKTKDELLEEVKKLREVTEKENRRRQINEAWNGLIWSGVSLVIFVVIAWFLLHSCGIL